MRFNYIIASYSGYNKNRQSPKEEFNLQIQLEKLQKLLKTSKYDIQITIVCPKPRGNVFKNYYQKEKWQQIFGDKIIYLDYVGPNTLYSYDQWLQAYEKFPNFDYYLFIEDDYYINDNIVSFDDTIINIYKKKFPDNIGYLASWYGLTERSFGQVHLAISNGVLSRETLERVPNILNEYKRIAGNSCQMNFGRLFSNRKIPIIDIMDTYDMPFWEATIKQLYIFRKRKDEKPWFFIPCQIEMYPKKQAIKYV